MAGADKVQFVPKVTGSEDFSYCQQRVPGLFFFVGAAWLEIDPAKAPANHSPRFHVDERALLLGVRSLPIWSGILSRSGEALTLSIAMAPPTARWSANVRRCAKPAGLARTHKAPCRPAAMRDLPS